MATRMGSGWTPADGRIKRKSGEKKQKPHPSRFLRFVHHTWGEMCYNHYIIPCAGPGGPQGRGAAAENGRSSLLRPKAGDLRAKGPAP